MHGFANNMKQCHLLTGEWINKLQYIHSAEHYSAIKIIAFMNLKLIMQHAKTQNTKIKPTLCNSNHYKILGNSN